MNTPFTFFLALGLPFATLSLVDWLAVRADVIQAKRGWKYNLTLSLVTAVVAQALVYSVQYTLDGLFFVSGWLGAAHSDFRRWKKAGRPKYSNRQRLRNVLWWTLAGVIAAAVCHYLVRLVR